MTRKNVPIIKQYNYNVLLYNQVKPPLVFYCVKYGSKMSKHKTAKLFFVQCWQEEIITNNLQWINNSPIFRILFVFIYEATFIHFYEEASNKFPMQKIT